MKSVFRKILSGVVAFILMITTLSACGEQVSLLEFIDTDSGSESYEGFVLDLLQLEVGDIAAISLTKGNLFGYPNNTTLCDAAVKRLSDVEKKLNCTINLQYDDIEQEELIMRYMGNNINYDAVYSADHDGTLEGADAGIFLALEDYMDYADLKNTSKYGEANVQEIVSFKGSIYGLCPITWPYKQPRTFGIMVFNMDPISQYGKVDPKEFLENNLWNWDALEEIITTYHVVDGNKEIKAMAARNFDLARLLVQSNGVELAQFDSNGEIIRNYGSENMMEALQWYKDVVMTNNDAFSKSMTSDSMDQTSVAEEICLGNAMCGITATDLVYYKIIYDAKNISMMPFPSGPRGEYGKWTGIIEGQECFSVFKNTDEPEIVITILDEICEPLEGYETEEDLLNYIGGSVLYNNEDAEIILNVHDHARYSYWSETLGSTNINSFYRSASSNLNEKSPMQVVEEFKSKIVDYVEEYMVPNMPIYDIINK